MRKTHVVAPDDQARRVVVVFRQHAFGHFSIRFFVEQVLHINGNLIAFKDAGDGFGVRTFDVAQGQLQRFFIFPGIAAHRFKGRQSHPV